MSAQSVDRDVPIARMRTLDDVLARSMAEPRLYAALLGVFAALAVALAASYLPARRASGVDPVVALRSV